jgi:tRNA(fMet)-specific endonuclease VapC
MAGYLLDSNHASPLVTLTHPLRQRFFAAAQAGHSFAICVPVFTEVWYGISLLPRAMRNRAEWTHLRLLMSFYSLDERDAEMAAELQIALRRQGRQVGTADALIATVAIRQRLILLTSDGDFRRIPQLQTENWL